MREDPTVPDSESLRAPAPTELLTAPELATWRGMLQVHAHVVHELDAEMHARHGLSLSAYEVLMLLADAPERRLRMSELAERVLLSRSGCTRLVDRLAELGFVSRCADDSDGRGLYAKLTAAGTRALREARATHHDGVRRLFLDRLTATDQIALGDIWHRFLSQY